MKCAYCSGSCIKSGFQKSGLQKFYCKSCKKYQQGLYSRRGWQANTSERISALLREGVSIRGISRILKIGLSTVIRKIKLISSQLRFRQPSTKGHTYEIDELWTYVGKKENEVWVMYALDRLTKEVINFRVGARTKENLRQITEDVIRQEPKRVCTDGLRAYPGLIPRTIHKTGTMSTSRIERFNLNLRTHLKRLSRKTICFSRSKEMLEACLKIYFWGRARGIEVLT